MTEQIIRLRTKGWSDRSIAKHLRVPLDAVQQVLGIQTYVPKTDIPKKPVVVVTK